MNNEYLEKIYNVLCEIKLLLKDIKKEIEPKKVAITGSIPKDFSIDIQESRKTAR